MSTTAASAPPDRSGSRPVVSVITIFLDAERFIEEAIRSVLAQTFAGWELLLVDDGSTDGGSAIARRYAAAYPERIRYLTHPGRVNAGMSRSRQLGIEHADGEFLAFLDADDVYLPQKLERQLAHFERYPRAAMVYGPTPLWYGWTTDPDDLRRDDGLRADAVRRLGVPPDTFVEPPGLVRQFLRRQADTPATCGVLVRRSAAEAVGGFERAFVDLYEDQVFFYKVCLRFPVYIERDAWDLYRRHPDSCCEVRLRTGDHAHDYRPTRARGAFLQWLEAHFREVAVEDRELWRLLRRELWPYRHPTLYRHVTAARLHGRAMGLGRLSHALRQIVRWGRQRWSGAKGW